LILFLKTSLEKEESNDFLHEHLFTIKRVLKFLPGKVLQQAETFKGKP
jgi:hypothetical protein